MHKDLRVFIWVGGSRGGAETVMLTMADFLHIHYDISPTLGLFRGVQVGRDWAPKCYVPQILPKRLVGYNYILASLWLGRKLADYGLVIAHSGGFWHRGRNLFVYREPGDLDAMMDAIPIMSKLAYWWPHQIAKSSLRRQGTLAVAASRRAQDFFRRIGVTSFVTSTNFINSKQLLPLSIRSYRAGQDFNLVFIGRDDKLKNLSPLIRVIERLSMPHIKLHIFGVDGYSTRRIIYHGWRPETEIEGFLRSSAHLFILPSKFEASPLSLLTALAYGVPSLVADNALPSEYAHAVESFSDFNKLTYKILAVENNYPEIARRFYDFASEIRNEYDVERVLSREFEAIFKTLK